ncbi:MAG: response regulator [Sandaracinus sp.]|nr:response regulator [Sandaracinus sp.]
MTGFSVVSSVLLVACFALAFDAQPEELASYFIPAVVVPAIVAPLAARSLIALSSALEDALEQSARRGDELRVLFANVPVGIVHLTTDGRVELANPMAARLLGCEVGEVWDAREVEDLDERRRLSEAITNARSIDEARWAWRGPSGEPRVVHGRVVPSVGLAERGVVVLLDDWTEREELSAQLQRAQQLNLAARLASGLAHDLNNLLTVVRASVDALGGATANSELSAIEDATARGAQLTRRLLSLSRREGLTLVKQPLGPVLHETKHDLESVLPSHVRLKIPDEVLDTPLQLDRDSVKHVLLNLVLNARDAMGGHRGLIDVRVKTLQALDGSWVVLEVHDDGPGMSAEVLGRATEAFFTTKPVHEGSGVGLAMVRETMAEHGGRLVLQSERGRGTVAALWFPVPADNTDGLSLEPRFSRAAAAREGSTEPETRTSNPEAPPKAYRILLVDDEASVRRVTERALRRLGHQVTSVDGIAAAIALLEGPSPVDLVLSDVTMPGGTGIDLIQRLRGSERDIPVLLTSGFAVESVDDILRESNVEFLAKPWASHALVSALDRLMASSTSPRAPAEADGDEG